MNCMLKGRESQQPNNTLSNEIEELGLTLWKAHVNCDEQRIERQRKFLQSFNTTDLSSLNH